MELQQYKGELFSTPETFNHAQRVAKMLSSSDIVPQQYRGNIANTLVAFNMANRMKADPMAVMQNLHIIHGRPAWSAPFLISAVNNSGKCTPLRYRFETLGTVNVGGQNVENLSCTAWAKDKHGEVLEGTPVTVQMAITEGWWNRKGSKWPSMTRQMLCYRAASFFARLYFPDLTMGLHTSEEVYDAEPEVNAGYAETVPTDTAQTLESLNRSIAPDEPTNTAQAAPTATVEAENTTETPPTDTVETDEWI